MGELGHRQWSLRDFDIGKPLGKGAFGKVYLSRVKSSGFIVALKCMDHKAIEKGGGDKQVRREIEVMQALRHPNVVRMYDYFCDGDRLVLMLEYAAQGELWRQLSKHGKFEEDRAASFIKQVAGGLDYLHSKNIIHRDIKPENLFLGLNGEVKIGDFGWSVLSPRQNQRTLCGTPCYNAPEMILGYPHGRGVDVWALGVLTFELVMGREPFEADTSGPEGNRPQYKAICRLEIKYPEDPKKLSPEGRDFIASLLKLHPEERMPLDRVPFHPWTQVKAKSAA